MKFLFFNLLALLAVVAHAGEQRIYQQDNMGNIQYHKPSYTKQEDGRIIETDRLGNKQYHKQQYLEKDGKIYQTNSYGEIQYYRCP
jgi:hypothetical protein